MNLLVRCRIAGVITGCPPERVVQLCFFSSFSCSDAGTGLTSLFSVSSKSFLFLFFKMYIY